MLALTKLFCDFQRPTNKQLEAALIAVDQKLKPKLNWQHSLFNDLPLDQFCCYKPPSINHGPIVICVLNYICSLSGHPQGLLYICEQTPFGYESRLTYRDPVNGYILQGQLMADGHLNMHWSYGPYFGNIQHVFEINLVFEPKFKVICLSGESKLVQLNMAQHEIAGFTTCVEATKDANFIQKLCRWAVGVRTQNKRMLVRSEGLLSSFPWKTYANMIFGEMVDYTFLAEAVSNNGSGEEAARSVAAIQNYLHHKEFKELITRIASIISELDSERYQPLKTKLWKIFEQN
jgi:hypothetical protein